MPRSLASERETREHTSYPRSRARGEVCIDMHRCSLCWLLEFRSTRQTDQTGRPTVAMPNAAATQMKHFQMNWCFIGCSWRTTRHSRHGRIATHACPSIASCIQSLPMEECSSVARSTARSTPWMRRRVRNSGRSSAMGRYDLRRPWMAIGCLWSVTTVVCTVWRLPMEPFCGSSGVGPPTARFSGTVA